MKQLIVRLLQFSIGSIGAALLNLILIPVTTYFLSPEEYGKTSMFLLAQTLLIYVIYLGFDQAFTREFYEYKNNKKTACKCASCPNAYDNTAHQFDVLLCGQCLLLAVCRFQIYRSRLSACCFNDIPNL